MCYVKFMITNASGTVLKCLVIKRGTLVLHQRRNIYDTFVAPRSSAIKSGYSSTLWTKLDGQVGLLMATGTARATLNVASPCAAYVKLVNASTGKTVGVSTMNVTAGYTGRDVTFNLTPNPLPSGIYDVYVQFDKSGIHYSLLVNVTSN